ncbi:hypothetical protein KVT40_002120 [Elsinoe batatas]|uniref:Autophagy-related protein 27 n=1 Tax=Elsinoe batatas TaxID=2601811 RepID=A0A8K0L9X5_9PEZI|nr:hypothetical protein KVT40_002120 [Elsinoe batatas]
MTRSSSFLLALLPLAHAVTFDCDHVRVDKVSFDLSKLSGPHSVSHIAETPPSISNTTFTIDLCKPLTGEDLGHGLKPKERCPTGTRVCAVDILHNTVEDTTNVHRVIPIAGELTASHGRALDPKVTRMKGSASNADNEKEGLRVELNGGKYAGKSQKAVVELVCDKERTGNEEVGAVVLRGVGRREDGDEDKGKEGEGKEDGDKEKERSLRFVGYPGSADDVEVLRLDWRTKYACENFEDDEEKASGGWGFFSWLFLIIFLGAAAYIIFGSWLNYSRYGARGWDLVPHGDSIRDLPYILKDWARNVIDTIQGGGYRGGYSAV